MYTGAIAAGIPVFVLKDFFRERLSLRWREWMTGRFVDRYFENRNFYRIQVRLFGGGRSHPRPSVSFPVAIDCFLGFGVW